MDLLIDLAVNIFQNLSR